MISKQRYKKTLNQSRIMGISIRFFLDIKMGGSIVDITLETLFKLCDWKIANKDLGIYVNTGVKLTDDDNAAYAYSHWPL